MSQHSRSYRLFAFLLLLLAGLIQTNSIRASDSKQDQEPLRVVTKEIEPFVFKEQGRFTGFSIDIWKEIALLAGLPFEFVEVESVGDQLAASLVSEPRNFIPARQRRPYRGR